MNKISRKFQELKDKNMGGLITYVTAGDPEPSYTLEIVESLANGGADIIELGIPFSDPISDGPTIQAASRRALKAGTTPKKVLRMVDKCKQVTKIPFVALTYYNPIFRMGIEDFFESASAYGFDGIIVPDLPIEESLKYKEVAENFGVDTIFLAAPTTSNERLRDILGYTSGFLYLVSVLGVTGAREKIQNLTFSLIRKTISVTDERIPIAVGFGISTPKHVETIIQNGAQAAIVGSAIIEKIDRNKNHKEKMLKELEQYVGSLKESTKKKTF